MSEYENGQNMRKSLISLLFVLSFSLYVSAEDVIRVGIIGLDTSHSTAFTELINGSDSPFAGEFKVVAAYPYGSRTIKSSYERIPGYIDFVKQYGVEITASIAELLDKVDCVLLETNDGRLHFEQAAEVFRSGKICYIDKPLGATLGQAIAICRLASTYGAPVFSSSALRYSPVNADIRAGKYGKVSGADCYSPHTVEPTHPDFGFYGIHGVETLFTVMGTGCTEVSRMNSPGTADIVTGRWADGRIGTFRAIIGGPAVYGGTVFTETGAMQAGGYAGYEVLVEQILEYFRTGKSPVSEEETLEMFAFMKASNMSLERGGEPVSIAEAFLEGEKEAAELLREYRLAVLDPAHFHAALVQKSKLEGVNDTVAVYAPKGAGLDQYLSLIEEYNSRQHAPVSWHEEVFSGSDFLEKALSDREADIMVLAGDNGRKAKYISECVKAGYNVLSDKPMAITKEDFALLEQAYEHAQKNGLLIYDLMTERYDTVNIAVRSILADSQNFGTICQGTAEAPAIEMKSVHHFYKNVSGTPLTRPEWYYDVDRQGEGIADVTTHLIDLVMWQCFPNTAIDFDKDVRVLDAGHYPTRISLEQFRKSTGAARFPKYLKNRIKDGFLEVYANGYILFSICGTVVRIEVEWNFEAPEGSGDTFSAVYRGTEGTIEVVQDASTNYVKQLFVTASDGQRHMQDIPVASRLGHEEHFAGVTRAFLSYLRCKDMPEWEKLNTLAKYKITTSAVEMAAGRKAAD